MCGVATTRGKVASAQSVGGSFWNTSRPAPPTWPLCRAASSAGSSISSPRAVLMMRTPFLHLLEALGVEEPVGLLGVGQVQRDVVGAAAQRVEVGELDVEIVGDVRGDERIVGDDPHAEGAGAVGEGLADAAEADHAEGLVAQLGADEALLLPALLLHAGVGGGHRTRQRQHQREGVLGDADAVAAGGVGDDDAAGAGGLEIDVVDARSGARDDLQPISGVDDIFRDLGGAAHEQRVRVGDVVDEVLLRPPGAGVDRPSADLLEQ